MVGAPADYSPDVPFSPEKERLGHNDDNDSNNWVSYYSFLDRYWMEPTPGSLRYTLQLRLEQYIEIHSAEIGQAPRSIDDVTNKGIVRSLLLQDIDAIQSRIDYPQRPIWKYIIGFLVTGLLGPLQSQAYRIAEFPFSVVARVFRNSTALAGISGTSMATKTSDIPRSVVLPWIAWTLLTIFVVRSEFRQWATRSISSYLDMLRDAAILEDPVLPSALKKIERRWLWSFLVWKAGVHRSFNGKQI